MGRDKSLIEVDGVPMVARVATVLAGSDCAPVVVVGGDAAALGGLGLERIDDLWPGEGPLGGIITALRWTGGPIVVTACDLPDLSVDAVSTLMRAAVDEGDPCDVAVAYGDRLEPLLALWYPSARPVLEEYFVQRGERAVHRVLDKSSSAGASGGVAVRRVSIDQAVLRNVNHPVDLPGGRSS